MRAKKWVYICDHCGKAELEEKYSFYWDTFETLPKGWSKLGKEDLCPECFKTYLKFKNEVRNELNKKL